MGEQQCARRSKESLMGQGYAHAGLLGVVGASTKDPKMPGIQSGLYDAVPLWGADSS